MPPASIRTVGDFVSLFRYTQWANDRVVEALRSAEEVPEHALELLSHLARAQDMWFGRVQGTAHTDLALWETDDLDSCAERIEASAQRWETVLSTRGSDDLDETISYENTSGTSFETSLREILSHVVNHGTHHRAQIALILRNADIEPPVTDYIFYVREQ